MSERVEGTNETRIAGCMIPPLDSDGCLPPGRHAASMDEAYELFVVAAPFARDREAVWTAFTLWSDIVWSLFPTVPLWVNGGFVTHKPWAAPRDIDVVAIVRQSDYNRVMTPGLERQLWTYAAPGLRIQPMGGYVDGFVSIRGHDDPRYWDRQWSTVTDSAHQLAVDRVKGYLEVRKP